MSFSADIVPLLTVYDCNSAGCHGSDLYSSNYNVESHENMLRKGDEAEVLRICQIKPGDPDASYLVHKIEGRPGIHGVRMPNGMPPMSAEHVALFRTWIEEGARGN